jgi:hypothetical protein
MMSLQKQTVVNLVISGSAVITGKPSRDQNIETMIVGVDIIVSG